MKQKWTMICAIAAGVMLAFLFVFYIPALKGLNRIKAEVAAGTSEEGIAGETIVMASNLTHALKITQEEFEMHRNRIPEDSSKLEVLHSIEKISRGTKTLDDVYLRILDSTKLINGGLEKQLFEVGFKGTYEEIAKFLYDATHVPSLITVERLIIAADLGDKLSAKAVMACYVTTVKTTFEAESSPMKGNNSE
jgi:hypothetical protein